MGACPTATTGAMREMAVTVASAYREVLAGFLTTFRENFLKASRLDWLRIFMVLYALVDKG